MSQHESLRRRSFRGMADLPLISQFLECLPATSRHLVDFPWRLSAFAAAPDREMGLWERADGSIAALAIWQEYWRVLDYLLVPDATGQEAALFAWGRQQWLARNQQREAPQRYAIEVAGNDEEQQVRVQRYGFLLNNETTLIQMHHLLRKPLPVPFVPEGFHMRPFGGEAEVQAYTELYRAAFASPAMTDEWRQWTLRMPQYRPDLDLVMVAPDQTLAGCCLGWFDEKRHLGQVEPLGVHPRFQRLGIGRALIQELLRRFQTGAVNAVLIEPEEANKGACQMYETLGFRPLQRILRKSTRDLPCETISTQQTGHLDLVLARQNCC